jgi:hypothetical protein
MSDKSWMGYHGGNRRTQGGTLSRFVGHSAHAERESAALRSDHPALNGGHTIFPSSVVPASASPRLLVSGHNSAKSGARIIKGPWAGMPIFTLTLEERATCPDTCHLWKECYGNAMPFARRHRDDGTLFDRLGAEMRAIQDKHGRFAVRIHVLGDFKDADYVWGWWRLFRDFEGLHAWGYTAHAPHSEMGHRIEILLNIIYRRRCVIRFSVPSPARGDRLRAGAIWEKPEDGRAAGGIVCPVSTGKTQTCGTCGLCWAEPMRQTPILFIGHGMRKRSGPRKIPVQNGTTP